MPHRTGRAGLALPPLLLGVIVLCGATGPLATDMYVPAFPHVSEDLGVGASLVQLTLTAFFVGMGSGQMIGGPVSDQYGRKRPLVMGTIGVIVASVVCALAPNITVLMLARFVQGFSGGWAMVVGRAIAVDLAHGPQLVRVMNILLGVGSIMPIIGPLLGAVILQTWDWRASFWTLGIIGVVMTVAALLVVTESLPPERRHSGGLLSFFGNAGRVLRRRRYVGYMLVNAFSGVALFAYVGTSSYVLQSMNGLSPTKYALDFAANAVGLMMATFISARLATSVPTRRVIFFGQCLSLTAGVGMLIGAAFFDMPLVVAMVGFFMIMFAQGFIGPNGGALASQQVPEMAGTGSAVLGLAQSLAAATAAPIAGLGGTETAVPMALLMVVGAGVSMVSLLVIARPKGGPLLGEP